LAEFEVPLDADFDAFLLREDPEIGGMFYELARSGKFTQVRVGLEFRADEGWEAPLEIVFDLPDPNDPDFEVLFWGGYYQALRDALRELFGDESPNGMLWGLSIVFE